MLKAPFSKPLFTLCLFLATMLAAADISAEIIQLEASKDNTLYENSGEQSLGAGVNTFMGMTGGDMFIDPSLRRTLVAFDLSSIPPNAVINGVQVSFTIDQAPMGAMADFATLHRMNVDWGEGASTTTRPGGLGAPAEPGDATWTHTFYDAETWTSPGGDFLATASATAPFDTSFPETMIFTSTETLVADVQAWLKQPWTNFGWVLKGDEGTEKNARRMASRESTVLPGPSLTIDYSIPAHATVTPDPDPADGPLIKLVQPGGSTDPYVVTFMEVGGEGVDGILNSCTLDDDVNFTITSPVSFPATIPAGSSVAVNVVGTDPGGVDSISTMLNCNYTDGADETTAVSYTLVMDIGGNGTFMVSKTFTDGSMGSVDVTLSCDTGLPLTQTQSISEGNPVAFVVKSFESGEMDCTVTEDSTTGYSGTYMASGESDNEDSDPDNWGCHFFDIAGGAQNACAISNSPYPVPVVITKEWVWEGASQGGTSPYYQLTLHCDSEIVGGYPYYDLGGSDSTSSIEDHWYKTYEGFGSDEFTAMVIPNYPYSSCWVEETIVDDTVEVENGCGDIEVSVNMGDSCTITNTVFYEGIPTLNQYGLAILALLMLGVGMVGFRRSTQKDAMDV